MMDRESVISDIVSSRKKDNPDSVSVVNALLSWEKQNRKTKELSSLQNLIGIWNLRFITGTKNTRKKAGVILGAGKYLPQFIKIQIKYESEYPESNLGKVINSVRLPFILLSLTGPIEFFPKLGILAFDFTYLRFSIGSVNIYQGYVKNGQQRETEFARSKLKERAFFKYFLIEENAIAARGKGGGLALWSREKVKIDAL